MRRGRSARRVRSGAGGRRSRSCSTSAPSSPTSPSSERADSGLWLLVTNIDLYTTDNELLAHVASCFEAHGTGILQQRAPSYASPGEGTRAVHAEIRDGGFKVRLLPGEGHINGKTTTLGLSMRAALVYLPGNFTGDPSLLIRGSRLRGRVLKAELADKQKPCQEDGGMDTWGLSWEQQGTRGKKRPQRSPDGFKADLGKARNSAETGKLATDLPRWEGETRDSEWLRQWTDERGRRVPEPEPVRRGRFAVESILEEALHASPEKRPLGSRRAAASLHVDSAAEAVAVLGLAPEEAARLVAPPRAPPLKAEATRTGGPEYLRWLGGLTARWNAPVAPEKWRKLLPGDAPSGLEELLRDLAAAGVRLSDRSLAALLAVRLDEAECDGASSATCLHLPPDYLDDLLRGFAVALALHCQGEARIGLRSYLKLFHLLRGICPSSWIHLYVRFRSILATCDRDLMPQEGVDPAGLQWRSRWRLRRPLPAPTRGPSPEGALPPRSFDVNVTSEASRCFLYVLTGAGGAYLPAIGTKSKTLREVVRVFPQIVMRDMLTLGLVPTELHAHRALLALCRHGMLRTAHGLVRWQGDRTPPGPWVLLRPCAPVLSGLVRGTRNEHELREVLALFPACGVAADPILWCDIARTAAHMWKPPCPKVVEWAGRELAAVGGGSAVPRSFQRAVAKALAAAHGEDHAGCSAAAARLCVPLSANRHMDRPRGPRREALHPPEPPPDKPAWHEPQRVWTKGRTKEGG
eukprot:TRINITY_DN5241_c1_g1_i1.p1 TRINITY_DN5241_c1_g1~~TRINITY_DN5241_c1_g1_i1.p1  ORF type:complete len:877 (+),score=161.42 TRINITY_DN5241_c1_g1_i1:387-2633(+)